MSYNALFEAVIIVAAQEDKFGELIPRDPTNSQLLRRYQDIVSSQVSGRASDDPEGRYADEVIQDVNRVIKRFQTSTIGIGFKYSVERIELLSAHLIEKLETGHENS